MTAVYFGFNPPFIGGTQGVLSRQEDTRLIKNDILQLLNTVPGERIHRPSFGTPLREVIFDPLTESVLSALKNQILNAISREEPRVTSTNVVIISDPDNRTITVTVVTYLTINPNVIIDLSLKLDAPGTLTA
jgi:phage baseplate assembly protein W